jgi:hypothetical protein
MNDSFDEVLAICLDRLTEGHSIARCTADYPEHPDLGPTLEVAELLMESRTPRIEPHWFHTSQFRLTTSYGLRRLRPTG